MAPSGVSGRQNSRHSINTPIRQGKALFVSPSDSFVPNQELPAPEPELVCREKELDPSVEDEIKDGFFELR
jgi:hypothetical protein